MDKYTRENHSALTVFDMDGQNEFNGVDRRTLHALASRGLVWFDRHVMPKMTTYTGGLTPKGKAVLAELNAATNREDGDGWSPEDYDGWQDAPDREDGSAER